MNSNLLGKPLRDLLIPLRYDTEELLDKSLRGLLLDSLGDSVWELLQGSLQESLFFSLNYRLRANLIQKSFSGLIL